MKINLKKELEKRKKIIWPIIEKYLIKKFPEEHYKMIREYPKRQGKYFRPSLLLLSNELFKGKEKNALLIAAAMQVSEEWLLIHDDVEDHSLERRSTPTEYRPTLHRIWGEELAINAGDALHIIMWKIMGDVIKNDNKIGLRLYEKMNDILLTTTEGQYLELSWIHKNKIEITENEYFQMIDRKTAYYTIYGPLELGAITAGITDSLELNKLKEIGIPFGRAFQIWDDAMNIRASSDEQGKENAGDILEGKRTLLLIHLLKNAKIEEKEKIKNIYLKIRAKKNDNEKKYIINLMHKYKSIDYAERIAKTEAEKAINLLEKHYPESNNAKDILLEAIRFVVNRKR